MEWYFVALIAVTILILLILAGVPIAISLGMLSLSLMMLVLGWERAATVAAEEVFSFWSSYHLLAVALFITMGHFLLAGGFAESLFDLASKWLRNLPGGLALVSVITCAMFSTLSGSSLATMATVGITAGPQMQKRGYSSRLAYGSIAAAGGIAHLIPPSTIMVLYAMMVEESAAKALMAGFIPGLVLTVSYSLVVIVWALAFKRAAPAEQSVSWQQRFGVFNKNTISVAALAIAMFWAIYSGAATVIEAAGLSAFFAIVLAATLGRIGWAKFLRTLLQSARTTAVILLIATGGKMLSWVFSYYMIPQHLTNWIVQASLHPIMVMIMIQVMWIFLGAIVDTIGVLFITIPIVWPVVMALGYHPLWLGVMFLINMETGLVTPPMGLGIYTLKSLAPDVPLRDMFLGALVFCTADIANLALNLAFPIIALWLPSTM
ncbi:TRAP transporter large permease [Chloroflexota bacterium]